MVVDLDKSGVIGGKSGQTRPLELGKRDDLVHFEALARA
jgi:hypothetical protein